ncbi:MAG: hypothetical protein DIZ77_08320 [endosymbiont of Seepiophila jonesi]|uniref:Phosphoglycerate mutase n=1 Tax=endosymbiont of Lamellibrachia luymesi TaxID=2200907 RepID=A0A370DA65_9GAMM|nr:MAG: hypothetical protein DIZ79_18400 [endosymbiont of Lamellibrachia luymesi]RDH92434.1 MAG: hypothetical protein DIZ77_08320 [endosymbiont of Seepiophila jonesi]
MAVTLHLLLPGLLGPMPSLKAAGCEVGVPVLERILARADQAEAPGHDLSTTLFSLFGMAAQPGRDLPEGAVNYLGNGGTPGETCWLRADPVHLRPDRDRLLLFNPELLDVEQAEADEIAGQINAHFAEDGIRLETPLPAHWYLHLEKCPDLVTTNLEQVVGRNIDAFLPSGPDAAKWRALSNEIQMLLFNAPLNQRREALGRLTINGLWLSGVGTLPKLEKAPFERIIGEDPTCRGLAQLAGMQPQAIPENIADVWLPEGEILLTVTDLLSSVLNADPFRWVEQLATLEKKVQQLTESMKARKNARIHIYPCNGKRYTLQKKRGYRFWRRSRPIDDLLDRNQNG